MNKTILTAAAVLGLMAAPPARAQLTSEELIDHAIAQAQLAATVTTMARAKVVLRRAANCLIGRDSGYFVVGAGGPCNTRTNLTTSTTNPQQRAQITSAYNLLLAGSGKSVLQEAQDYAEDATKLLEEAKAAEE